MRNIIQKTAFVVMLLMCSLGSRAQPKYSWREIGSIVIDSIMYGRAYIGNGDQFVFVLKQLDSSAKVQIKDSVKFYREEPYAVEGIAPSAFKDRKSLTSVVIPPTVKIIGNGAFSGCSSLASVVIPSSVDSIEYKAFSGCSSLTNIVIPSSVTSLGANVFSDCSSLTNVVIPSSVTSLGANVFSGCSSLANIVIPSSVTHIGYNAFSNCSNLTSISIPSSVKSIGGNIFSGSKGLTNITLWGQRISVDNKRLIIPASVDLFTLSAFDSTMIHNLVFEDGDSKITIHQGSYNIDNLPTISYLGRPLEPVFQQRLTIDIDTLVVRDFKNLDWFYRFSYDSFNIKVVIADMPSPALYPMFNDNVYENATLIVPHGSKTLYENAEDWKNFKTIIEKEDNRIPTGINKIKKDKENRKLVDRIDLRGQKLTKAETGINILRYDDGTMEKVLVK